jgi:hypothetical protein
MVSCGKWLSAHTVEGMTSATSDDDSEPTATASSGPVGRPEDAKVPPGDDTLDEIMAGTRPSGHVLTPDPDASDQDGADQDGADQDASDDADRDSKDSFPASDPPANY